jgi:hypothetical protein
VGIDHALIKNGVKRMSMYKHINDIMKVLRFDETLLRLLHYPAENKAEGVLDPLDTKLPNLLDKPIQELWEIRDKHILSVPKSDDLENEPICRVVVYAGKRRPTKNYLFADQEIIVDVLCHMDFEQADLRSMRISDQINELLCLERITGIGRIDYVNGGQMSCPNGYVGYRNVYDFGSPKK